MSRFLQIIACLCLICSGAPSALAQDEKEGAKVDVIEMIEFEPEIVIAGNAQAVDKTQNAAIVRGMIQSEIDVVQQLCSPTDEQKQALVDIAEREWFARTSVAMQSLLQPQGFESIDLDGLAERCVLGWIESVLSADQRTAYQDELEARNSLRKKAVLVNMIDSVDKRVGLSYSQMKDVEKAIDDKWKDRWYRSLESVLAGANAVPEVRLTWVSSILSESQRQSFANKAQFNTFVSPVAVNVELFPRLKLDKRFSIGTIVSSETIPVGEDVLKKPGTGKKKPLPKAQLDPIQQGVDFVPVPPLIK